MGDQENSDDSVKYRVGTRDSSSGRERDQTGSDGSFESPMYRSMGFAWGWEGSGVVNRTFNVGGICSRVCFDDRSGFCKGSRAGRQSMVLRDHKRNSIQIEIVGHAACRWAHSTGGHDNSIGLRHPWLLLLLYDVS